MFLVEVCYAESMHHSGQPIYRVMVKQYLIDTKDVTVYQYMYHHMHVIVIHCSL